MFLVGDVDVDVVVGVVVYVDVDVYILPSRLFREILACHVGDLLSVE